MSDIRMIQIDIQRFLTMEAQLLEKSQFDDWLALLSDDVHYVMPIRESLERATAEHSPQLSAFALYDEDKRSLELRARRINTGMAHAEVPLSVTQRFITNVFVEASNEVDEFVVSSNFLVYQERRGRHSHMFIGSRLDRIKSADNSWKIHRREIRLAQTIMPATISIFF